MMCSDLINTAIDFYMQVLGVSLHGDFFKKQSIYSVFSKPYSARLFVHTAVMSKNAAKPYT